MPELYRIPAGTVYPATVQGYKLAKAGKLEEVDWIEPADEDRIIEPPYPEIVSSWLANGIEPVDEPEEEVSGSAVLQR